MARVRVFLCSVLVAQSVATVTEEETTTHGFNVTETITGVGEPKLVFLNLRHKPPLPIGDFRLGMPCSCSDVSCGCCVGMRVEALGFDRTACMNLTYVPNDLTMESNFFMDEESLYRASITVKSPPPLCIPIPVPFLPVLDMCARFSNIYTKGANLHVCLKLEARLQKKPLVMMQFDCMTMGYDGVSVSQPGGGGTFEVPPVEPADSQQGPNPGGDGFYDEVTKGRAGVNMTWLTSNFGFFTAAERTRKPPRLNVSSNS